MKYILNLPHLMKQKNCPQKTKTRVFCHIKIYIFI